VEAIKGVFAERYHDERLLVDFTFTHFQTGRFLEPVKAIQVRLFKPKPFVIGQSDGDGVFMGGDQTWLEMAQTWLGLVEQRPLSSFTFDKNILLSRAERNHFGNAA
jgi:hypothetical protein